MERTSVGLANCQQMVYERWVVDEKICRGLTGGSMGGREIRERKQSGEMMWRMPASIA